MKRDGNGGGMGGGGVSRRTLLKAAAGGAAVSVPTIWRRAHAQPRRIICREPGGPYTAAVAEAYFKPFREATGIEVVGVASGHYPTSQIKAMVETKTYTWDMAAVGQDTAAQLAQEGSLEPLGVEGHPDVRQIPPEYRSPYFVGDDVYASVLAYRTDAFKGRQAPGSWADLWDVKKFPGRRAMRRHPIDTIEQALLADGVPSDQLYPCDVDRAFRSLDRIKPHVAVWFTTGAQTSQMLKTGEVDICTTWNARAQVAIDEGAPVAMAWKQSLWVADGWVILKGTPVADLCREFIKFAANAERQAVFTKYAAYGPTNPKAYDYIDPKRAVLLPTHPENRGRMVRSDYDWWAANKDRVLERFNAWLLS